MIDPATLAALGSQNFEWLVLVRFEFDEGALAFSNLFDVYSFEGFDYQPFGTLGDISSIEKTLGIVPQWMDIDISGVRAEVLQAVLTSNYFNRDAYVHLGAIQNGQVVGAPFLHFAGKVDSMDCKYDRVSSITIKCADELADWERPKIERYTDQDQQARYPGDKGFEFVAQVDTREVVWPARNWFVSRA